MLKVSADALDDVTERSAIAKSAPPASEPIITSLIIPFQLPCSSWLPYYKIVDKYRSKTAARRCWQEILFGVRINKTCQMPRFKQMRQNEANVFFGLAPKCWFKSFYTFLHMFLPVEHRSYNRVFKISSTFKLMFRLGSIKKVVMQFKYFHAKFRKILISTGVKQLLGVC